MASKAVLKKEFLKSGTVKIRYSSMGKSGKDYPVTLEKLCEMKDNGTLPKKYLNMFEPDEETEQVASVETPEVKKKAPAKKKAETEKS